MSPLALRWITAIFILAGCAALLWYGTPLLFLITMGCLGLILAQEWGNVFAVPLLGRSLFFVLGTFSFFGLWKLFYLSAPLWLGTGLLCIISILFGWCVYFECTGRTWQGPLVVRAVLGYVLFLPMLFSFFYLASQAKPQGILWLSGLILLVSGTDTAAFFVGRAFGKHRLAPQISPGKTIEGGIGALVIVPLIAMWVFPKLGIPFSFGCLAMVFLIIIFSILGDLCESMFKRFRGIKDSGRCLPGHGGLWDRLDGFTLSAPVYVVALRLLGLL